MMEVRAGNVTVRVAEEPTIEFYHYRSEETNTIVYQREGTVILLPYYEEMLYSFPPKLSEIEIGNYRFIGCHIVQLEPSYGVMYRFSNFVYENKRGKKDESQYPE